MPLFMFVFMVALSSHSKPYTRSAVDRRGPIIDCAEISGFLVTIYLFIYLFIYLRTQHSKQYKIEDTIKAAKF